MIHSKEPSASGLWFSSPRQPAGPASPASTQPHQAQPAQARRPRSVAGCSRTQGPVQSCTRNRLVSPAVWPHQSTGCGVAHALWSAHPGTLGTLHRAPPHALDDKCVDIAKPPTSLPPWNCSPYYNDNHPPTPSHDPPYHASSLDTSNTPIFTVTTVTTTTNTCPAQDGHPP